VLKLLSLHQRDTAHVDSATMRRDQIDGLKIVIERNDLIVVTFDDVGGAVGRAKEVIEKLRGGVTPLNEGMRLTMALARKWVHKSRGEASIDIPDNLLPSQDDDDDDDNNNE
jgi:hypothetical protein